MIFTFVFQYWGRAELPSRFSQWIYVKSDGRFRATVDSVAVSLQQFAFYNVQLLDLADAEAVSYAFIFDEPVLLPLIFQAEFVAKRVQVFQINGRNSFRPRFLDSLETFPLTRP